MHARRGPLRPRASHGGAATFVVIALAALASACRNDGREMRDPTAPLPPTTTLAPVTVPLGESLPLVTQPPVLTLVAPWPNGAAIPARHTCDGVDVSPALTWTNVPSGTVEVAVTMTDLDATVGDAAAFTHWIVYGLNPARTGLVEAETPAGAFTWTNDFGEPGWRGPCPPPGDAAHTYLFTVHALNQQLEVADDATAAEVVDTLNQIAIAQSSVSGTYARAG